VRAPACEGLVKLSEGRQLARIAGSVPRVDPIIEVGSHTGGSTVWMTRTAGAPIYAVDPWRDPRPDTLDDPFGLVTGDATYAQFERNLRSEGVSHKVTPIRTTGSEFAAIWTRPVGLVFIDAIHERWAVEADFLAWQPHLRPGSWLALHDYTEDPEHPYYGVAEAVRDVILPAASWSDVSLTEYLWCARFEG
jgi:predicted O-methyltransferase YrrM